MLLLQQPIITTITKVRISASELYILYVFVGRSDYFICHTPGLIKQQPSVFIICYRSDLLKLITQSYLLCYSNSTTVIAQQHTLRGCAPTDASSLVLSEAIDLTIPIEGKPRYGGKFLHGIVVHTQ